MSTIKIPDIERDLEDRARAAFPDASDDRIAEVKASLAPAFDEPLENDLPADGGATFDVERRPTFAEFTATVPCPACDSARGRYGDEESTAAVHVPGCYVSRRLGMSPGERFAHDAALDAAIDRFRRELGDVPDGRVATAEEHDRKTRERWDDLLTRANTIIDSAGWLADRLNLTVPSSPTAAELSDSSGSTDEEREHYADRVAATRIAAAFEEIDS